MATSDADFYETQKFGPQYDEPPRQRGCFFYGCIISSVLALLVMIALGLVLYVAYRGLSRLVDQYTATVPVELPRVDASEARRQSLRSSVDEFRKALEEGKATEALVLSADDINALIDQDENWKGKLYVAIERGKIKGKVSVPLEDLSTGLEQIGISMLRGRFLNGEVGFNVSFDNGVLVVAFDKIEVNGKPLPEELMSELRKENLAKDAYDDPKSVAVLRRLEAVEITDDKLIIKPLDLSKRTAGKDLPDDVLAPSGTGGSRPEPAEAQPEAPRVQVPGDRAGPASSDRTLTKP
jgi:hypothetical protein